MRSAITHPGSADSQAEITSWPRAYKAVLASTALVTAALYLWCARAANGPFDWRGDHPGYYDLLATSFVAGHLNLPFEPSSELLALPNPWNPQVSSHYGPLDIALYHRHFYLYHGVTPAWLLFTPYRFLTHRNLPEAFAVWLFCWLAYLCGCGTLTRCLAWARLRPPLLLFGLLLLAMAVCQSVPYLLERVAMYEVAISGGYFCLTAGFWFLSRALLSSETSNRSLGLAGLFFGLAPGCRPNLAFATVLGIAMMIWHLSRQGSIRSALRRAEWWAFVLPLGGCALLLAQYNYARFGNPLEFGTTWQIAPPNYFRPTLALYNLVPGLYYLLLATPAVDPVFPFYRLAYHLPFNDPRYPLHMHFFVEPIVGVFVFWPVIVLLFAAPWVIRQWTDERLRRFPLTMFLSAVASLLLTAALGLATQRFHLDWLPYFVLINCFVLAALVQTESSRPAARRRARRGAAFAIVAILYSVFANLALGLQGPYDRFVQAHPRRYVKYAAWFSPIPRLRPLQDPQLTVEASFEIPPQSVTGQVPLISAGCHGSKFLLTAEMLGNGRVRLASSVGLPHTDIGAADVQAQPGIFNHVRLDYEPQSRTVRIRWNGAPALDYALRYLVTAPVQVRVGEDRAELDPTPLRYPWSMRVGTKRINGISY